MKENDLNFPLSWATCEMMLSGTVNLFSLLTKMEATLCRNEWEAVAWKFGELIFLETQSCQARSHLEKKADRMKVFCSPFPTRKHGEEISMQQERVEEFKDPGNSRPRDSAASKAFALQTAYLGSMLRSPYGVIPEEKSRSKTWAWMTVWKERKQTK